jgi:hypothetical protein
VAVTAAAFPGAGRRRRTRGASGAPQTGLSTSTALAAWNAAIYVAQIDDDSVAEAMKNTDYMRATTEVVLKHGGLWFQDESFVVVRRSS